MQDMQIDVQNVPTNTFERAKNSAIDVDPAIKSLFDTGAHIGRSKSSRHPGMSRFIFGTRNNIEIFDLKITEEKLKEAESFLEALGKEQKIVLWVGTKPAAHPHIESAAKKLMLPYVTGRWIGGLLTNAKEMEKRFRYWQELENEAKTGALEKYVKKERLLKLSELQKLTRMFEGLRSMRLQPSSLVIVDSKEEITAFREAQKRKLSVVAIINSDCDPSDIAYPIPANNNSYKTIALILNRLSAAYEKGRSDAALSNEQGPDAKTG